MGVNRVSDRKGRTRIEVRKRWPDGTELRRYFTSTTSANQLYHEMEIAISKGNWREFRKQLDHGTNCDEKVSKYADHYLEAYCKVRNRSWNRKESSLKHIKRILGRLRLKDVEVRHVHQFAAKRLREEVKAATVNRDLTTLRHMFEFAAEEGVLAVNPIARIEKLKEIREERPRVTEQHFKRILKHLPFPARQIVVFIYETGCRPSEALALKHEYLDLQNRTAIINMRKGGDNALIALTSRAVEAIQAVPILPDCPYVFWNPQTCTRYERINETFSRARKKAGLDWIQLKDFRRELGIVIAESGQPLHVAQTQLGHSSIRTTEKYYARYSPEFAVERARPVMEDRGRQSGDTDPKPGPLQNHPKQGPTNILSFQGFKERIGGGERIRTAE